MYLSLLILLLLLQVYDVTKFMDDHPGGGDVMLNSTGTESVHAGTLPGKMRSLSSVSPSTSKEPNMVGLRVRNRLHVQSACMEKP